MPTTFGFKCRRRRSSNFFFCPVQKTVCCHGSNFCSISKFFSLLSRDSFDRIIKIAGPISKAQGTVWAFANLQAEFYDFGNSCCKFARPKNPNPLFTSFGRWKKYQILSGDNIIFVAGSQPGFTWHISTAPRTRYFPPPPPFNGSKSRQLKLAAAGL